MSQIDHTSTLPLLYARGTHYEVGYQIGSTFQKWIKRYFNHTPLMQRRMLPFYYSQKGRQIYNEYLTAAEATFPQYITEIRGMADGSEIPFEHLFLMNVTPEEYSLDMEMEDKIKSHDFGCSSVFLNKPDLKIMAHNVDCEPINTHFGYIINAHIIDPDAKTGTHGIAYALNDITPKTIHTGSPPVVFRSRAFLSACDVDDFVRIARNESHGASVGFNANIASLSYKEMWSLEVGPGKSEIPVKLTTIAEQKDHIQTCHYFHFNYYQQIHPDIPSSIARSKRMSKPYLEIHRTATIQYSHDPDHCVTSCTVLFNILEKTMEIYVQDPSLYPPFWKFPLTF
ncbi:hypothetical protein ACJMK2_014574 [Sinanodonta woodiana]|uniref:Tan n=1 Tax=Sinanodonta woodiana TaxID=1069815 RepID=A0ABD3V146_SINWO